VGTNLLAVLILTNSVVVTNWTAIPRYSVFDNGTNYHKAWISEIRTDTVQEEAVPVIVWHTNRMVLKTTRELFQMTNSTVKLIPVLVPPLPGAFGKE
jgi:hypothetical protein